MRILAAVILFLMALTFPAWSSADSVDYSISGTLDDGGIFAGSFTLDNSSPDLQPSADRGEFELVDFEFELTDTTLFMSGMNTATSGTATSISLFQNSSSSQASLSINLVADGGTSGVFTDFIFTPFSGDANELQFLDPATFDGGFFDGAGSANIVDFNLEIVPEPTSGLILLSLVPLVCFRRSR